MGTARGEFGVADPVSGVLPSLESSTRVHGRAAGAKSTDEGEVEAELETRTGVAAEVGDTCPPTLRHCTAPIHVPAFVAALVSPRLLPAGCCHAPQHTTTWVR